ncbi:MAG: hypothetical protein ABF932_05575 [Gluconobacter potus]|uniref:Uncharacterized protein n=1 Tax=Gluconobacter potus TaxID=2724927 RepID=A0ABR9YLB8_9PROT|nr:MULTISPECIES: hypothetical protein [Gluconobacter]MBF0864026.1 hypothetical protein [Gluconobacter sp. R71656]MBF0867641.1 hypothetical protein [Gluconobacter sp. R75628]MBF0873017.1 hypothetical protein [Gluconobacter sp. R75629]MBF0882263.1 hypothetical protein [Gluconobacter potus]
MTVIIAEIRDGVPILIGDMAVFHFGTPVDDGIVMPLSKSIPKIQSAQQKIMRLNNVFAIGGAGDAATIQKFCYQLREKAETIRRLEDLRNFLADRPVDFTTNTDIAGVFSGSADYPATAFKIDLRQGLSLNERFQTGKSFVLGEKGAQAVVARKMRLCDNQLHLDPGNTTETENSLITIMNHLMLDERGTQAPLNNNYGLAYKCLWHDGNDFRPIPGCFSIFGDLALQLSSNDASGKIHLNYNWLPGSRSFFFYTDTGQTVDITVLGEDHLGQKWEVPPLLETSIPLEEVTYSKADITRPIAPQVSGTAPKSILLCVDVHIHKAGQTSTKVVPVVYFWSLMKYDVPDMNNFNYDPYLVPDEAIQNLITTAISKYFPCHDNISG